ncbi:MAG: TAT-variant-translocated molybdopterin oxidoreductase [Bacteroidota bacterium]
MIELDILTASDVASDDAARAAKKQPRQWRSAADRDNAPGYDQAFRKREFLDGAMGEDPHPDRRDFLKVMGASIALAGITGCRRPVEEVLPYARKPETVIPGIANYFATAMPLNGVSHALLVRSHEGRPTKVEGNPEHPVSQGASGVFAQASILNLYDPDRSRHARNRVDGDMEESDWTSFVAAMAQVRQQAAATSLVVLAEPDPSPTAARLRQQVEDTFPGTRWITLHPQGDDSQALGTQLAFGRPLRPQYNFSEADVVVSFDADFLGAEDSHSIHNAREYMQSRRVEVRTTSGRTPMSRLYAVESTYTGTGGMADHRLAMKAGRVSLFAAAVASALGLQTGAPQIELTEEEAAVVDALAGDVREASGRAVFTAGAAQPPRIHALCAALNGQFGTQAVEYLDPGAAPVQPVASQLREAVAEMSAGRTDVLLTLGTNPVHSLPAELGFAAAMQQVPLTVHFGTWRDETAQLADWHVPQAHYLESWGDGRSYDGTFTIVQPLIAPLYADAHSALEVLGALITGRDVSGYDLVRESFADRVTADFADQSFENNWRTVLHDGFLPGTQFPTVPASAASTPDLSQLAPVNDESIEMVVRLSSTLYDGRFSNNAWMQEAPDPITKIVWDNVAAMSAATARRLGVSSGIDKQTVRADTVTITGAGNATVTLPVWIQPGHPDNSISVTLGYGRELLSDRVIKDRNIIARIFDKDVDIYRPGPLTNGVGSAVEGLRSVNFFPVMPGVDVRKAEEDDYRVVTTQDHGSMEGRDIVRMLTAEQYTQDPDFIQDQIHLIEDTPWEDFPPLWGESNGAQDQIGDVMYSANQWGMAVDLNACHGCNACVVACQAENNIPVVGKDQVGRGREMSWMRMDRYYVGGEETDRPGMVSMPMMCQHCENAPCEQVCPVAATVHSPDGLNAMIYNRCIGTRYCANNCPYKVRRYNFYNWTKTLPIEVQMQQNPSVTIRYRGVMEKCTMCIHRIRQVQQYAHIEDRDLSSEDIEYVSACQEACSTGALVFGDLADPDSEVNRVKRNSRNYALLAELAVRPRVTYLARLRNPHPALVAAGYDPFHAEDGHHGGGYGSEESPAETLDV